MNYSALVISILALLFTVFSFYWMNWRRGELIISAPRSYAAKGSQTDLLLIELPLVFFNSGPIPIVVQNLRLMLSDEQPPGKPLRFIATVEKIGTSEGRTFAMQFPVRGREATRLICEFQRGPGSLVFKPRIYPIELQGKLDQNETWETLCSFVLRVNEESIASINTAFVVHDNEEV